jgi:hypothetical protein
MNRIHSMIFRLRRVALSGLLLAGCASMFSAQNAHEVSRDRLLQISEAGTADHLLYMGSDFNYHYAYDSRAGKERSYKIRAAGMPLRDSFPLGEDSYVLRPWVIEGKPLGRKTEEMLTNAPPAAVDR